MKEKSKHQKLKEKLFRKKESAWKTADKKVHVFAEEYMQFLAKSKTERTASREIVAVLKKKGFEDIEKKKKLAAGDKVFLLQKNKSVIAAVIGKKHDSMHLVGSHIDSPRLDIKPNPLYEDKGLALMKTHYYGGIKKYQWVNTDLALYGVIHTKKGKQIEWTIGEKDDDPRFLVSDLLPHLSKKQMEKSGSDIIDGEQLNIYLGNIPVDDKEVKEKVKLAVLKHLNDAYGLIEEDFSFAELTFVPADAPREIGFDRSLIAGYGHDDKSCSFANLRALLDAKPTRTAVAYFSDKEEIGSMGNTGAHSYILLDFAEILVQKLKLKKSAKQLLKNSKAVSADVTAAVNPSFSEVHDERNASHLGYGISIEKYTGAGGKYGANDASAEYMQEIRALLDEHNIVWQTGEIGKVDQGGGGTIALYLSRYGMDTVDAGPAVLGMHSPREVLSKVDLYEAYRFYKAFFSKA